ASFAADAVIRRWGRTGSVRRRRRPAAVPTPPVRCFRHPPRRERNGMRKHLLATAALAAAASVTPPPAIKSAGKIVFCTDPTYPQEESLQGTTYVGSDIDIATEVGKQMGVKAQFKNTTFDSIIAALKTKKCDAI